VDHFICTKTTGSLSSMGGALYHQHKISVLLRRMVFACIQQKNLKIYLKIFLSQFFFLFLYDLTMTQKEGNACYCHDGILIRLFAESQTCVGASS